ncbi:MAG: hypothetical protein ACRDTH_26575 [Pseudonocardiaceae bacterium]
MCCSPPDHSPSPDEVQRNPFVREVLARSRRDAAGKSYVAWRTGQVCPYSRPSGAGACG